MRIIFPLLVHQPCFVLISSKHFRTTLPLINSHTRYYLETLSEVQGDQKIASRIFQKDVKVEQGIEMLHVFGNVTWHIFSL